MDARYNLICGDSLEIMPLRMVTPHGGTVFDPFMGSGSTGKAAMTEGFNFIGIEKDEGYAAIAHGRILHATGDDLV